MRSNSLLRPVSFALYVLPAFWCLTSPSITTPARAETPSTSYAPSGPALTDDPTLRGFVKDALERRPELAQLKTLVQAEGERKPRLQALPDPLISLGIQNDGFQRIQIGVMETSWASVAVSQTFPWFGKLDLRGELANQGVRLARADLKRTLLTVQAEVERAYVDLLLNSDQLRILDRLDTLWDQAETVARVRYEVGEAPQSDFLRAQLEKLRLRQRRLNLEAEQRRRMVVLNRARGHAVEEVVKITRSLVDIPDPTLSDRAKALADAEVQSPEIEKARVAQRQAEQSIELAKKDYFPDITVTAGLMPRGGRYETMWQAGLSFTLPIWASSKQARAVAESEHRQKASVAGVDVVRKLLHERVSARLVVLKAQLETLALYRSGLLKHSEVTVTSTLSQYQVGRAGFASVLEATNGYFGDMSSYLDTIAAAQRSAIAHREVSLELEGGASAGPMGASPSGGSMGSSGASRPSPASAGESSDSESSSGPRM